MVNRNEVRLPPLGGAVRDTRERGYAYLPRALMPRHCQGLVSAASLSEAEPVPEIVGEVRQYAKALVLSTRELTNPWHRSLVNALVKALPTAVGFVPTELTYMSYSGSRAGISPHRDQARFKLLIAIFTLQGRARFRIHRTREATDVIQEWITGPGDLVLLRAPGLNPQVDARPFHSIEPPIGDEERISLSVRMERAREVL
jgi:hypothetical protein